MENDRIVVPQDDVEIVDSSEYTNELASYNYDALFEIKKVLWEGTNDWDSLLYERAAISGRLVLSDFTKNALEKFKK